MVCTLSVIIGWENIIFTENGIIEIASTFILILCLLRCGLYARQSRIVSGRTFWLASVLVFIAVLRRELNHLPDLLVSSDFLLLGQTYEWWEDSVLVLLYLSLLSLLIYSWRYCWAVLKRTPPLLYILVALLAVIQYMGENAIVFPENLGVMVEELTEIIIYSIALYYVWTFGLTVFEDSQLTLRRLKKPNHKA